MADQKISELAAAAALDGSEIVEAVQGGVNVQTTTQDIADLGGGGGGHTIEDEGTPLTQRTKLNFVGAGVTVTDDSGDDASVVTIPDPSASESAAGKAEIATQTETNTGSDDARIVTPLKLKNKDGDIATFTDGATVDITSGKGTLATSSATRTFTISHTGDDITMVVTLSATSSVFTFPANALCVSEGVASGDNTCSLAGVSGDKYLFSLKKFSTVYYVFAKNVGQ